MVWIADYLKISEHCYCKTIFIWRSHGIRLAVSEHNWLLTRYFQSVKTVYLLLIEFSPCPVFTTLEARIRIHQAVPNNEIKTVHRIDHLNYCAAHQNYPKCSIPQINAFALLLDHLPAKLLRSMSA